MSREAFSWINPVLMWMIGLQIAATIVYFVREEMKGRSLAIDISETKKNLQKQIDDTNAYLKEEVNKLEAKDELILERMGRIELQILSMLSELSIKVGKIEGMLTNLHSSKN